MPNVPQLTIIQTKASGEKTIDDVEVKVEPSP